MHKKLTVKIKEFCNEIKETIVNWKKDTLLYIGVHPMTGGFFLGTGLIWAYLVLAAKITGKVWDLVEKK